MPEGPEVTREKDNLNKILKNKILKKINILSEKIPKGIELFKNSEKLKRVCNKGKLIYFIFENYIILNHMMLSGYWSLEKDKYSKIEFIFSDIIIYFCDKRNFGYIELINEEGLKKKLESIGIDFLNGKITLDIFKKIMEKNKLCDPKGNKKICNLLIDQKIISGIGNYLRSEILYSCGIRPDRKISSLTNDDIKKIFINGREIIKNHYKKNIELEIYNKKNDKFGNKIEKMKINGRNISWVPKKQK